MEATRRPCSAKETGAVILLYCAQSEVGEYAEYVELLRAQGHLAAIRSVRYYAGEVERRVGKASVSKVLFTEDALVVEKPYAEAGIEVECVTEAPEPIEALPDLGTGGDPEDDEDPWLPDGYLLKREGPWWKAFGPTGRKAGRAHQGPDAEEQARQEAWKHFEDPDPYQTAKLDNEVKRRAQGLEE